MTEPQGAIKRKVHRSPNYPSLSLGEAMERARRVYDAEKRTPAGVNTILAHLGYKPGAGPGYRSLSALRHYGLLEESSGQDRISDAAFHILTLSETSPDRQQAIREAAMRPTLFRQVWDHYKGNVPSDLNLRDYLIKTHSFNPDSVPAFIKAFRETVQLAKLHPNEDNLSDGEQLQTGGDEGQNPSHKAGAFPRFDSEATRNNVTGEQEFISVPLSAGMRARVLMSGGPVGIKDIDKLIKVLTLQKELLGDDAAAIESPESEGHQE